MDIDLQPWPHRDGVVPPPDADRVATLGGIAEHGILDPGERKPFLRARTDRERLVRHRAACGAARRSSV